MYVKILLICYLSHCNSREVCHCYCDLVCNLAELFRIDCKLLISHFKKCLKFIKNYSSQSELSKHWKHYNKLQFKVITMLKIFLLLLSTTMALDLTPECVQLSKEKMCVKFTPLEEHASCCQKIVPYYNKVNFI